MVREPLWDAIRDAVKRAIAVPAHASADRNRKIGRQKKPGQKGPGQEDGGYITFVRQA
jgi:anti-sigma factor RsiW